MKCNLLLLANSDAIRPIERMLREAGHEMQCLKTSRETFGKLHHGLGDVDVIILDLDRDHEEFDGVALLESVGCCEHLPPVVALTGLEEAYMAPIAFSHGAAACIGKPFTADRLLNEIRNVISPTLRRPGCRSDLWGHPLGENVAGMVCRGLIAR